MSSLYLNRLSKEQREGLVATLLNSQSGNCFICGKTIELAVHGVDIDHIEPTKVGGKDGPENFAATHESCNRMKKASDLRVARILASFDQISESISEENRAPNLGDILARNNGSKYELAVHVDGDMLKTSFTAVGRSDVLKFPVYNDDLSGFKYAFMNLPIEYIHHDDHINPRAIGKNLKKLVEEFHKKLPQLHVALGWIDTGEASVKVRVFDGQHKAAAQVLLGANHLPVRIFLNPDRDALLTREHSRGYDTPPSRLRQVGSA